MTDGAGRAVGKWLAGIVAAVLASVLAFVVISKISGPATPATGAGMPSSGPLSSPSAPTPLWYLTLTNEQLTAALLRLGNLDAGYAGTTQVGAVSNECLDATATVLNGSGRKAGPVQVRLTRAGDNVHNDRVTSIQEALASYATDQAASVAMNTFTGWVSHCGNMSVKSSNPALPFQTTVRVTTLSFQPHGDETLAATWLDHYNTIVPIVTSTPRSSYFMEESILVVVRLHRTVGLFAVGSEPVEDGQGYASLPAIDDVNGIVTTAIGNLMSLGTPG